MQKINNIRWIIVATYKTKPEDEGWYIAREYKSNFWKLVSDRFGINLFSELTKDTFNKKGNYGYIESAPNIIFFDLVKNTGNSFNTTRDEVLYELPDFKKSLIKGLSELDALIEECRIETRVGLVGRNTAGIFVNSYNDINLINKLEFAKIKFKKTEYGILKSIIFKNYKNSSFYFLENITSRYYKTKNKRMLGWDVFWK